MKKIIFILVLGICFSSCLEQIELETESEIPKIVVDGSFTDVLEKQTVKLSFSMGVSNQTVRPVADAQVTIEDQNNNTIVLTQEEAGTYTVVDQAVRGNQYRVIISLANGEVITSNFQNVPNTVPIDSVSIRDSLTTFVDEDGKNRRLNAIHFYAHTNIPNVAEDMFLRYDFETAFRVAEIICSPLITPKTCYISNDDRPQTLQIQTLTQSTTPKAFTQYLYFRPIDYPFGEIFGLEVSLLSYNESEYGYWEDLKSLFDQNGDITDILPGRLRGNMTSSSGEDVLGLFAVVGKTSSSILVRNSDFAKNQRPYCGVLGMPPWPLPSECCNCLAFDNSSLQKPDFWP